jgi:catechol 2,3-dioxygenase-like lactoylglutathione lyase family enzyme
MTDLIEFDHSAVAVNDLDLAEHFYVEILGQIIGDAFVQMRSPTSTEDIIRRFKTLMDGRASRSSEVVYRGATPHSTARLGRAVIPFSIYQTHVQEPPPEQLRGLPRLAFHVTSEQIDIAVEVFRRYRVAFAGPVAYPAPCLIARSLYFKDPSSNFLELSCSR